MDPRTSIQQDGRTALSTGLEARRLAPAAINLRLVVVRRLAFEGADTGDLSPELAVGIAGVKRVKRIGAAAETPLEDNSYLAGWFR